MIDRKLVGLNVRLLRQNRNLTLRGLEEAIGMSDQGTPLLSFVSIGRIETGKQEITLNSLRLIADALNCSVEDFFWPREKNENFLITEFRSLSEDDKKQLINYLKFLKKPSD